VGTSPLAEAVPEPKRGQQRLGQAARKLGVTELVENVSVSHAPADVTERAVCAPRFLGGAEPQMFREYRRRCENGEFRLGDISSGSDGVVSYNWPPQPVPRPSATLEAIGTSVRAAHR
jgi:hypothetical protein